MAKAFKCLQLDGRAGVRDRLSVVERHLTIVSPVYDESRGVDRLQKPARRKRADRPMPNAFQMVLVGALRCRC